ncbi:MAG: glycosyltransferase [Planctomycetes bacterium]|jgi:glycosyltransferase involved in cell wall biosynthesis|nr:glycosyltransferase [Phycisphaerae bacterium]NBB95607.1 glycosyltransferase [Planctomycetota bacterium]
MNIAMFTNTYLPQVGGVAKSLERFRPLMEQRGHEVLIVAPTYEQPHDDTANVYRIPAVQKLDGSDFSLALPVGFDLGEDVDAFDPDIVHSHHPFLLGNSALRYASPRNVPLIFTHHTMYEHYTHYVPVELEPMKDYVIHMATGYANFTDAVVAPSKSTAEILRDRGVRSPIHVVPSGVDIDDYAAGDGNRARQRLGIPSDASLVGTVGRLAPEKNLPFLARAMAEVMSADRKIWALIVGRGPATEQMQDIFAETEISDRARFAGVLEGSELCDAYHAMDVFAFASKTETQGMVLVEAMAAGQPVVALDAPGAREVVDDGNNGRLLESEDVGEFAEAISSVLAASDATGRSLREAARQTARRYSTDNCVETMLRVYREVIDTHDARPQRPDDDATKLGTQVRREVEIWANRIKSIGQAILAQEQAPWNHHDET